jgi:hypothetical protein
MHKVQIVIGIALIIVGTTLLLSRMEEEASYQKCLKDLAQRPMSILELAQMSYPYPQLQNDPFIIPLYVVTMCIGIWILICGLKSISIVTWARES